MTGTDSAKGQDDHIVWCCQHLIKNGQSLPKGESAETMGEFVEFYRASLQRIKQRKGKSVLLLEIEELAKKWPTAQVQDKVLEKASNEAFATTEEMKRAAEEIFGGTWIPAEPTQEALL